MPGSQRQTWLGRDSAAGNLALILLSSHPRHDCFLFPNSGALQNPSDKDTAAFILHPRLPLQNSLPLLPSFHRGNRFWRKRGTTANSAEFLPNPAKKSKHSREAQGFIQSAPWFLLAAKNFARPYFACLWRHGSLWSWRLVKRKKKKELDFFPPDLNLNNVLRLHYIYKKCVCVCACVLYTHNADCFYSALQSS